MRVYGIYRVDQKPDEEPWDKVMADLINTSDEILRFKKDNVSQAFYSARHFYATLLEEL